ncbi:MAG: class I SAM-dependent methyltransferase [Bacteroidia bacterium]
MDRGCEVTGIEISETAIAIARRQLGEEIKVYHGGVGEMPFDKEVYEGIFCYALIHLLSAEERKKLIRDCYDQLAPGGCMVFVTLSKGDARYGQGVKVAKDSFLTQHGVTLFFYDLESIEAEFGSYGLSEVVEINEPREFTEGMPRQRFWWIECLKGVE